jgi:hypothetical protein
MQFSNYQAHILLFMKASDDGRTTEPCSVIK